MNTSSCDATTPLHAENIQTINDDNIPDNKIPADILQKIIGELMMKYKKDGVLLNLEVDKKLTPINSCVGGVPYFPKGMEYPMADGQPLILLCQINYSEMPKLANFPTEGLLQFFIGTGNYYGTEHSKLIYHKTVSLELNQSVPQSITDVLKNALKEDLPFKGAFRLTGKIGETFALPEDRDTLFEKLAMKYSVNSWDIEDDVCKATDSLTTIKSQYGGCPNFIDENVYEDDRNTKEVLLLQLASEEYKRDEPRYYKNEWSKVNYCQYGSGFFFINGEKLKKLEFDDVTYTYDCD
ncbi:hypothetical protein EIN_473030 [Entamoeba invadens IP1]|uniref:DUF1963 domain-containing protein n=1 Tax=Entamoeba invadens IP1 TaxID=370355 RepID=A0A0A1UCA6_ENTIV|nr:hypothetical protein EIN_473030 [Entamoeba invadens IP1]ELP89905.1 hypothetical protein EIN_473030 [Entamoeba invadens IP1]|eukprot:XP_004256676.1 hypothetical protein EIN_473030 [Entamoeba invadens IP1]